MMAAIDDRQVGYIETHGTGTPLCARFREK